MDFDRSSLGLAILQGVISVLGRSCRTTAIECARFTSPAGRNLLASLYQVIVRVRHKDRPVFRSRQTRRAVEPRKVSISVSKSSLWCRRQRHLGCGLGSIPAPSHPSTPVNKGSETPVLRDVLFQSKGYATASTTSRRWHERCQQLRKRGPSLSRWHSRDASREGRRSQLSIMVTFQPSK